MDDRWRVPGARTYVHCERARAIVPRTYQERSTFTMAARSCLCRLCQSAVPSAHAVCLFGPSATRQSLSSRISDLLDVPIAENDGYPEHVCEKCKRRLERLEKAAEDLENFRSQANSSYIKLRTCRRGELKQTKETSSSVGISPDTDKNRPPSKRRLTQKRLDFTQSKKLLNFVNIVSSSKLNTTICCFTQVLFSHQL